MANTLASRIYVTLKEAGAEMGIEALRVIEQVLADEWIPVAERLPERDAEYPVSDSVLVWVCDPDTETFGDGFIDLTIYHYELEGWLTDGDEPGVTHEDYGRTVTHWRELPAPPGEAEE